MELAGDPAVPVTLVRSARAKRMSLRVSRLDGTVRLTIPSRCSEREAWGFLSDRADWVRKHVSNAPVAADFGFGTEILFHGTPHKIISGPGRSVQVSDGLLAVGASDDTLRPKLKAFLKHQARRRLTDASQHYARALDVSINRISLKDTRSRWGSCSSAGNLNYSWRLIMAPPAVLDYVAAHEVAHRIEMNHSDRFWALVADMFPDHRTARKWLKDTGPQLHAYDL